MNELQRDAVLITLHYQNENCHPDGKIKVGIKENAEWRDEVLAAAKRLLDGAREHGLPVIHVRLAVRPDHRDVMRNCFIYRQWVEVGAWKEGTWGVEFYEGLGPTPEEIVVNHTRNSAFYNSQLQEIVNLYNPKRIYCAGVSTAYVVESTVRHASDVGYETYVVADACSTATKEMHNNALSAMSYVAEVTTTDELLQELAAGKLLT